MVPADQSATNQPKAGMALSPRAVSKEVRLIDDCQVLRTGSRLRYRTRTRQASQRRSRLISRRTEGRALLTLDSAVQLSASRLFFPYSHTPSAPLRNAS